MTSAGYIIVTLQFWREGDQWVGLCPELGTSVCGDTIEDAEQALKNAIPLHLNTLEDVGERRRFFREHRIHLYRKKPAQRHTKADLPLDREILTRKQILPVMAA